MIRRAAAAVLLTTLPLAGCGGPSARGASTGAPLPGGSTAAANPESAPTTSTTGAHSSWAEATFSPRVGAVSDPRDAPVGKACGGGIDAALVQVAGDLARALAEHGHLPDAQEIEFLQRKAGSPHVWARTFGAQVQGTSLDRGKLAKDVTAWLGPAVGRVRCGVASVRVGAGESSTEALAVVSVDPVADLASIPTHPKVGAWIDVDASLLRGGDNGRVVVLPPSGPPKSILSSTGSSTGAGAGALVHVKARFALAVPGRHVVQVLADDEAGPRPMVEAEVWAGVEPPATPPSSEVPGEAVGDGVTDPAAALFARLNGARTAEGIPALVRDPSLDKVSRAHADAMMKARLLGHDVGDGDPGARVASASVIKWKVVGENVAKARTGVAAHRALYASPSHRGNMLDARFTKVGVSVAVDPKTGDLWVAQTFGG